MDHLEQLFDLSEALSRAERPEKLFEAAMNGLRRTLGAQRAAVLLLDKKGVMRFVAVQGLSKDYRLAAEGHSPWRPGATDPEPVLVPNVLDDESLAPLAHVILGEGIRALGFLPLVCEGRLLGKLMIYYDAPHAFSDEEVRLAHAVARMIAIAIDRRRREEDLRHAVVENRRLLREAESASAEKSRFLASISHDLRTPANAVLLNATLLHREVSASERPSPGEIEDRCARIEAAARAFADLLNDLLEIGTLDAGRKRLSEGWFPVREFAEECFSALAETARAKGLHYECALPEKELSIRGDRTELARVVLNLLSNAIKFTETGSVRLQVARSGGGLSFGVVDTGIGIAPEQLESVFSESAQLHNPERDHRQGTGLGLAISHRIMEALGGELDAASVLGGGSVFTARLPAVRVYEGKAETHPKAPGSAAGNPLSLLLVDDDVTSAGTLAALLRGDGYRVVVTTGGEEAIEAVRKSPPDVLLLDMMMPGIDGLEVAHRVRQTRRGRSLRIVALTGDVTRERVQKARDAGVDEFLGKPIVYDRLIEMLRGGGVTF